MTDDEIHAELRYLINHQAGITAAFTQVIKALQAQPAYDHQVFLRCLAAIQVSGEQTEKSVPAEFHKGHQEILASFAKPQPRVQPLLRKPAPPQKG